MGPGVGWGWGAEPNHENYKNVEQCITLELIGSFEN